MLELLKRKHYFVTTNIQTQLWVCCISQTPASEPKGNPCWTVWTDKWAYESQGGATPCIVPAWVRWHCWFLRTGDSSCRVRITQGFPHVMVGSQSAGPLLAGSIYLHQRGYPTNHGHRSVCLWAKVSSSWNVGREQKGLRFGNQIPCWTRRRLNKALLLRASTAHTVGIPVWCSLK